MKLEVGKDMTFQSILGEGGVYLRAQTVLGDIWYRSTSWGFELLPDAEANKLESAFEDYAAGQLETKAQ